MKTPPHRGRPYSDKTVKFAAEHGLEVKEASRLLAEARATGKPPVIIVRKAPPPPAAATAKPHRGRPYSAKTMEFAAEHGLEVKEASRLLAEARATGNKPPVIIVRKAPPPPAAAAATTTPHRGRPYSAKTVEFAAKHGLEVKEASRLLAEARKAGPRQGGGVQRKQHRLSRLQNVVSALGNHAAAKTLVHKSGKRGRPYSTETLAYCLKHNIDVKRVWQHKCNAMMTEHRRFCAENKDLLLQRRQELLERLAAVVSVAAAVAEDALAAAAAE